MEKAFWKLPVWKNFSKFDTKAFIKTLKNQKLFNAFDAKASKIDNRKKLSKKL